MTARCENRLFLQFRAGLGRTDRHPGPKAAIQAVWTRADEVQFLRHKNSRFVLGRASSPAEPAGSAQVENLCKIRGTKILQNIFG